MKVKIVDLTSGGHIRTRAIIVQRKTKRPVQFELLEPARSSLLIRPELPGGAIDDSAFPTMIYRTDHLSTRQYAHLVDEWMTAIGLQKEDYGTHSLRRTKASIISKANGIYEPSTISSVTRRWNAPFAIWGRCRGRTDTRRRHRCLVEPTAAVWLGTAASEEPRQSFR